MSDVHRGIIGGAFFISGGRVSLFPIWSVHGFLDESKADQPALRAPGRAWRVPVGGRARRSRHAADPERPVQVANSHRCGIQLGGARSLNSATTDPGAVGYAPPAPMARWGVLFFRCLTSDGPGKLY